MPLRTRLSLCLFLGSDGAPGGKHDSRTLGPDPIQVSISSEGKCQHRGHWPTKSVSTFFPQHYRRSINYPQDCSLVCPRSHGHIQLWTNDGFSGHLGSDLPSMGRRSWIEDGVFNQSSWNGMIENLPQSPQDLLQPRQHAVWLSLQL